MIKVVSYTHTRTNTQGCSLIASVCVCVLGRTLNPDKTKPREAERKENNLVPDHPFLTPCQLS